MKDSLFSNIEIENNVCFCRLEKEDCYIRTGKFVADLCFSHLSVMAGKEGMFMHRKWK